jgi:hypothetical protein
MKKMIVLICLMTQSILYSQDSISIKFTELYNNFRKENNLSVLKYSEELEKLATERIMVVSKECDKCFSCVDWETVCPGTDLHFKAISMLTAFNADTNNKINASLENAVAVPEFHCKILSSKPKEIKKKMGFFQKIGAFFSSIFDSNDSEDVSINYPDNVDRGVYQAMKKTPLKEEEIPLKMFEMWKDSKVHRRAFENKEITHYGFKYFRTIHDGNPWIHGVWIGGYEKNSKK